MTKFRRSVCNADSRDRARGRAAAIFGLLTFASIALPAWNMRADEPAKASPLKGLHGGDVVTGIVGELTSIAYDRDGVLWIGSRYLGIFACKDGKFTLFNQQNAPIPDVGIAKVFVDRRNVKWFVSAGGALCSFDNSKWHVWGIEKYNVLNGVNCVCDDPQGNLWLGMEGGTILKFKEGKFAVMVNGNGFSDRSRIAGFGNSLETVVAIACDSKGRLWVYGGKRYSRAAGADLSEAIQFCGRARSCCSGRACGSRRSVGRFRGVACSPRVLWPRKPEHATSLFARRSLPHQPPRREGIAGQNATTTGSRLARYARRPLARSNFVAWKSKARLSRDKTATLAAGGASVCGRRRQCWASLGSPMRVAAA